MLNGKQNCLSGPIIIINIYSYWSLRYAFSGEQSKITGLLAIEDLQKESLTVSSEFNSQYFHAYVYDDFVIMFEISTSPFSVVP